MLKNYEQRYKAILDIALDGYFFTDLAGHFLKADDIFCEMSGYSESELLTMSIPDFEAIETHEETAAHVKKIIECGKDRFETKHIRKDGTEYDVEISAHYFDDGDGCILSFVRDISDRKQAEKALKRSEEKYKGVFDESIAAIYLFDNEKNFIDSNQAGLDLLGYSREELLKMSIPDVDADPKVVLPAHGELLSGGNIENYEHQLIRKDGTVITVLNNSRALTDGGDNIVGMLSTLIDITKRKQVENTLVEKEIFQEALLNDMLTFVGILQPDGDILFVNNTPLKVGGIELKDIKGKKFYDAAWWTYSDEVRDAVKRDVRHCAGGGSMTHDIEIMTADGSLMWIEYSMHPIFDKDGNVKYLIPEGRDISSRKKAEEESKYLQKQLLHSQKMESIGVLAGGVAHDFNNMLGIIVGATQLGMKEVNKESKAYREFDTIKSIVKRSKDLTSKLLAFSRTENLDVEKENIIPVIKDVYALLNRTVPKTLKIELNNSFKSLVVEHDRNQLYQAMINLCNNGIQAMPDKGVLTIETGMAYLDEKKAMIHEWLMPGEYCYIKIMDQGVGIARDDFSKIFDPFYTSKPVGKGTGLGLSVTHGIVKAHKGHISIDSELGQGSVFTVWLPLCEANEEAAVSEVEEPPAEYHAKKRILLIDDEELIIETTEELVVSEGYDVVSTTNPEEGIRIFANEKGKIDVVLLDYIMPDANGEEVFHKLKEIDPDVKVIVTSGYSEITAIGNMIKSGIHGYIQKPYEIEELYKLIEKAING